MTNCFSEESMAYVVDAYLNENYDFRRNVLSGKTEMKSKVVLSSAEPRRTSLAMPRSSPQLMMSAHYATPQEAVATSAYPSPRVNSSTTIRR